MIHKKVKLHMSERLKIIAKENLLFMITTREEISLKTLFSTLSQQTQSDIGMRALGSPRVRIEHAKVVQRARHEWCRRRHVAQSRATAYV